MTRGDGIVGYNVQMAVDTQHHLIVAHKVTNVGSDRDQLSSMAKQARDAIGSETLSVVADRGTPAPIDIPGLCFITSGRSRLVLDGHRHGLAERGGCVCKVRHFAQKPFLMFSEHSRFAAPP